MRNCTAGSELKIYIIKIKGIMSSTPTYHNWMGIFKTVTEKTVDSHVISKPTILIVGSSQEA
jgi:hypothetical protein